MDIDCKTPVDITKEHNAKKPPFPRRAPNLGVRRGKGGFMFRERGTIFPHKSPVFFLVHNHEPTTRHMGEHISDGRN